MHTSMTTLTQTWMIVLLSNVLPSDHNSDLPLPKCQLVYAIQTRVIGGRITLLRVTGTPKDRQRPVISAGNPKALLDLSRSRGCLVGAIPANK